MQRLLATLLLFTFSAPLLLPLLSSQQEENNLPACCRRDGDHKCRMRAQAEAAASSDGLAIKASAKPCSQYPGTVSFRVSGRESYAGTRWTFQIATTTEEAGIEASAPPLVLVEYGSARKRGPPSFHA